MARGVFFYAKANSLRQELYVEPNPDNGLATLAKLHFDRLSRADELMLTAASEGKPTRIDFEKPSQGGENDPFVPDSWNPNRRISAGLLRWLCVDVDASKLVDPRGIRILGCLIDPPQ
jgi:hypothetical protein